MPLSNRASWNNEDGLAEVAAVEGEAGQRALFVAQVFGQLPQVQADQMQADEALLAV
ncbi:hypothetical protein [Spirillospora sp. CA-128828]|uniref:hypothetical protein n=1 Tax=Spirillospora sp. CA-128828 TaxID=3240033 RepID=UPI003D8E83C5